DGIRDKLVTGVQTCALPISRAGPAGARSRPQRTRRADTPRRMAPDSIREGMNELGRMERADKWEWIIERCREAGEPSQWQRLPDARPRTLAACRRTCLSVRT